MYPLFSGNLVYRHIEFMFMIKTENVVINFILHNIYHFTLIYLQDKDGATHSGLGPPISITNFEKCSHRMLIIG